MTGIRQYVAVLCALLVAAPAGGFAADPQQPQPAQPGASAPPPAEPAATRKTGVVGWVTNPYRPVTQPSNSPADPPRLASLFPPRPPQRPRPPPPPACFPFRGPATPRGERPATCGARGHPENRRRGLGH